MRKSTGLTAGSLALTGYGDIFNVGTHGNSHENSGVQIVEIPLSDLYPPDFHPFQVNDDEAMQRLAESVKQYGVHEPGLVRRQDSRIETVNTYELLSGNRRKRACELAGLATMPVIIRELSDDEAAIAMVDGNLFHRETLLPSEKAWAYRVKMEALNHCGVKSKSGAHSVDVLTAQTGDSKNQIFRLIRLTELIPALLDKVDARRLAFNPAVELSYLSRAEQTIVLEAMARHETKPSLSQAVRLKKQKQERGALTENDIDAVLAEEKKPPKVMPEPTVQPVTEPPMHTFKRFFPAAYTEQEMARVIVELLSRWQLSQQT